MAEFLSEKRVLLSNPGRQLNNVYYTQLNSSVEQVEVTFNNGKYRQSLNSLVFGGQALITIPNSSLVSDFYLHLELPATVANQTLQRGWGYGSIRSINYLWGSSNVSQVQMSGQSVFQTVMQQCENAEKRSELLRLAGDVVLTAGVVPKADLLIPLPWSTACSLMDKKPFDTNILNDPITIQIQFNDARKIYGGDGVPPTAFSIAEAILKQGEFTNKALSLRNSLMANPSLMSAYPFIHHQSFSPGKFTVVDPANTVNIVLQSFINADLLAITIGVINDLSQNPSGNNSPSQFNYVDLQDVRLLFNGIVMCDAPGNLLKLINCKAGPCGGNYVHNDVIQPGTVAPFTSDPVDTYIYEFDFAKMRSLCFEGQYENVQRFGNQVLTLEFKVPAAGTYQTYATYHYNGICEINRGQSNIYFN